MNERIDDLLEELHAEYKTMDPFHIIEMKGIYLEYVPFIKKKTLGLYMKSFDEPTIYLKECLEESPEKYFIAAHELHHALEHEDLTAYYLFNSKSKAKMEQEANKFATAMCMNFFVEEHGLETLSSIDLKRYYGVPIELSEILL